MILADTSVWIEHFRHGLSAFARQLETGKVQMHTVVLGELAIGNLSRRAITLNWLGHLPMAVHGTTEECLKFIETEHLWGRGLGWDDVQLLVAARLSSASLWSLDLRLGQAARSLGVAHFPGRP